MQQQQQQHLEWCQMHPKVRSWQTRKRWGLGRLRHAVIDVVVPHADSRLPPHEDPSPAHAQLGLCMEIGLTCTISHAQG